MIWGALADPATVKVEALIDVPAAVLTAMGPLAAPEGTKAQISVALSTMKPAAARPLKATAVAPMRLLPVIMMMLPAQPLAGRKPVTCGAAGGESVIVKGSDVDVTADGGLFAWVVCAPARAESVLATRFAGTDALGRVEALAVTKLSVNNVTRTRAAARGPRLRSAHLCPTAVKRMMAVDITTELRRLTEPP